MRDPLLILGLDIATRTGWALSDGQFGAIELPGGSTHSAPVYARLYGAVCDILMEYKPAAVFIEHPAQRFAGQNLLSIGLAGAALAACGAHDIAVAMVPPTTLKKFATGKGNADKVQMIDAARRAGFKLSEEQGDEADAIHLARYGVTQAREVAA